MSKITTHILDTTKGKPAEGVTIVLFQLVNDGWKEIARGTTNKDGRIADLLSKEILLPLGTYKMNFNTKEYFDRISEQSFYPFVDIAFDIQSGEHYHVPLLLNPFGYSTYRGS